MTTKNEDAILYFGTDTLEDALQIVNYGFSYTNDILGNGIYFFSEKKQVRLNLASIQPDIIHIYPISI